MIQTILALYILAVLDTMFSGICAASGRNALIDKRAYYIKSMLYGFAWGQAACLAGFLVVVGVALLANDRSRVVGELVTLGQRMVWVYAPYAGVVLLTFAFRAIPSVDVRSITSVVGFGPLTMLRPFVIISGLAWGLSASPSPGVVVAGVVVGAIMVPFRVWLNLMLDRQGVELLDAKLTAE